MFSGQQLVFEGHQSLAFVQLVNNGVAVIPSTRLFTPTTYLPLTPPLRSSTSVHAPILPATVDDLVVYS